MWLTLLTLFVPLQELERGGRVDEEDMARLIQQLEGRVGTEVPGNKSSHFYSSVGEISPTVKGLKTTQTYLDTRETINQPLL